MAKDYWTDVWRNSEGRIVFFRLAPPPPKKEGSAFAWADMSPDGFGISGPPVCVVRMAFRNESSGVGSGGGGRGGDAGLPLRDFRVGDSARGSIARQPVTTFVCFCVFLRFENSCGPWTLQKESNLCKCTLSNQNTTFLSM